MEQGTRQWWDFAEKHCPDEYQALTDTLAQQSRGKLYEKRLAIIRLRLSRAVEAKLANRQTLVFPPGYEPNAASKLEWVKGEGVDRDGHSLAWWKNKAAKGSRSVHDRMTVFIQVRCWDRTGASTRDQPQFEPGELQAAKAWAKDFIERTGGSCQVDGRVTIPFQSGVTIPLGEWKNAGSDGFYVWSVDGRSFVPVSRRGPFRDQDEAVTHAKQQAKGGGTYDSVITFGGDPEASDFEILKSFKAWSGEVHYQTDLPKVGGRLREYR